MDVNLDSTETVSPADSEIKTFGTESEVRTSVNASEKHISKEVFKKPQLIIGPRRGKAVGKVRNLTNEPLPDLSDKEEKAESDEKTEFTEDVDAEPIVPNTEFKSLSSVSPAQKIKENSIPLPYKEPKWGGIPKKKYGFEVLKNGKIVFKCDLETKSFYVFGRLSTSDFHMAHPTISRHHAILQYRSQENESNPEGFYIYDLGSTHGTFLNKSRIKSNIYVRMQVGHMLKLGCSTRLFVLTGPEDDMEEESDLTVTQLKEKREIELAARELEEMEEQRIKEEKAKRADEEGIDWGMSEDADEETDLTENPFAATQNEELYINDPKKTLRGWFEREGYDLEYDVEEKGFGQFLCRVELPIESSRGSTMVAEALVKGKKKEAVVQCALEACRLLDRYGLLRQATHESKKRKAKDWEAEDFYDSDEDTFLDRTGTVEKKRQQRMRAAGKKDPGDVVETYESLIKKHSEVLSQLQELEDELHKVSVAVSSSTNRQTDEEEEDALDAFMSNLSRPTPDKSVVIKLKSQIAVLKQEEVRLRKLVNIAKPANLPEIKPPENITPSSSDNSSKKTLPMVGSRKKASNKLKQTIYPETSVPTTSSENMEVEIEEEEDEDNITSQEQTSVSHMEEETQTKEMETVDVSEIKAEKGSAEDCEVSGNVSEDKSKVFGPAMPPSCTLDVDMKIADAENKKKGETRKSKSRQRMEEKSEKLNQNQPDYDSLDADYSTWVPPEGQTGDGRTKLNEKYGY